MKKGLLSAILVAVLLVSGCSSGVSQESYNSVVEENSKLQSDNKSLQEKNNSLENDVAILEEKALKENEIRFNSEQIIKIIKLLTVDDSIGNEVDVPQYNIRFSGSFFGSDIDNTKAKGVFNLKTKNTIQEKAAFLHYYIKLGLGKGFESQYSDERYKNDINLVTVINDYNGEPIAVWVWCKNSGKFSEYMCLLNSDLSNAIEDVINNPEKWEVDWFKGSSNNGEENSSSSSYSDKYPSSSVYDMSFNKNQAKIAMSDILKICSSDFFSTNPITKSDADNIKAASNAISEYLKSNEIMQTVSLTSSMGESVTDDMKDKLYLMCSMVLDTITEIQTDVNNSVDNLVAAEFGSSDYQSAQKKFVTSIENLNEKVKTFTS